LARTLPITSPVTINGTQVVRPSHWLHTGQGNSESLDPEDACWRAIGTARQDLGSADFRLKAIAEFGSTGVMACSRFLAELLVGGSNRKQPAAAARQA